MQLMKKERNMATLEDLHEALFKLIKYLPSDLARII